MCSIRDVIGMEGQQLPLSSLYIAKHLTILLAPVISHKMCKLFFERSFFRCYVMQSFLQLNAACPHLNHPHYFCNWKRWFFEGECLCKDGGQISEDKWNTSKKKNKMALNYTNTKHTWEPEAEKHKKHIFMLFLSNTAGNSKNELLETDFGDRAYNNTIV